MTVSAARQELSQQLSHVPQMTLSLGLMRDHSHTHTHTHQKVGLPTLAQHSGHKSLLKLLPFCEGEQLHASTLMLFQDPAWLLCCWRQMVLAGQDAGQLSRRHFLPSAYKLPWSRFTCAIESHLDASTEHKALNLHL